MTQSVLLRFDYPLNRWMMPRDPDIWSGSVETERITEKGARAVIERHHGNWKPAHAAK